MLDPSVALTARVRDVTGMNDLVRSYVTHLEAGDASENTVRDRRNLLRRLDRELPKGLDEFSTEDLEEWLAPYTGWTAYTYVTTIKDFGRFAVTAGHEFDPAADLAQPKTPDDEPRPASDEQLAQALAKLTGVALIAVTLAAFNSLRCGEISRLHREHVDRRHLWAQRKGAKTQLLPTHEKVWQQLASLPPGPVVTTPRGYPFSPQYLSQVVSQELTRIGQPDVTCHCYRAAFATRLANEGVHITRIQKLMGHKRLDTTERYVKVTDGQLRDAITKLPVPASHRQEARVVKDCDTE